MCYKFEQIIIKIINTSDKLQMRHKAQDLHNEQCHKCSTRVIMKTLPLKMKSPKINANNNHPRTSSFKTITMIENTKDQQHSSIIQTTRNNKRSIKTIYTLLEQILSIKRLDNDKRKKKQGKECHLNRKKCKRV